MTTEPYNFELLFSKTSRNKLLSNIKTINDALWDNIHNIVKINACNIPSIVSELDPRYEPAITLNTIWIERNFTPIYIYWKDLQLLTQSFQMHLASLKGEWIPSDATAIQ